jgi:beta-lactamase regulating signal transducer with metallopeptidase domain
MALPLAYLIGCGACMLWLLIGYAALIRAKRSALPPPRWLLELIAELPRASNRRLSIIVTRRGGRAMSWGIWRPTIALPADLCRPANASRLRQVLLHELSHVIQKDAWGNLCLNLAFPLLYFHPLYWWLRYKVRFASELVADDWAAAQSSSEAYATELIALVKAGQRNHALGLPALAMFRSPTLF